ncbi:MAG: DUF4282 domain-containing protein [Alphaproteobacteria bacterium]|nr:DUF4282 domain-containing protein [Alphaproteobacteria bacterium]
MEPGDFFTFKRFVTPKLITLIYWIGLFFIIVMAIAEIFGGTYSLLSSLQGGYGTYGGVSVGGIILGLIYAVVGALFWRVFCEIWVVVFSINDRLGKLVDMGKSPGDVRRS